VTIDFRAIAAEVKENLRKRRACPQHLFPPAEAKMQTRVVCTRCTAWLGTCDALAYCEGFRAAGGDTDEVWPGAMAKRVVAS
jgi:hypothetical protein